MRDAAVADADLTILVQNHKSFDVEALGYEAAIALTRREDGREPALR